MLRCHTLFPTVVGAKRIERLSVDYSVDCDAGRYAMHRVVALVFLAVAAVLPAFVLRRVRALSTSEVGTLKHFSRVSDRAAAELGVGVEDAKEAITHLVTGREFSFMTAGLAPQCLWWEAVVCHPLPRR